MMKDAFSYRFERKRVIGRFGQSRGNQSSGQGRHIVQELEAFNWTISYGLANVNLDPSWVMY